MSLWGNIPGPTHNVPSPAHGAQGWHRMKSYLVYPQESSKLSPVPNSFKTFKSKVSFENGDRALVVSPGKSENKLHGPRRGGRVWCSPWRAGREPQGLKLWKLGYFSQFVPSIYDILRYEVSSQGPLKLCVYEPELNLWGVWLGWLCYQPTAFLGRCSTQLASPASWDLHYGLDVTLTVPDVAFSGSTYRNASLTTRCFLPTPVSAIARILGRSLYGQVFPAFFSISVTSPFHTHTHMDDTRSYTNSVWSSVPTRPWLHWPLSVWAAEHAAMNPGKKTS